MEPTREFDKALKQIEKRIEELEALSKSHGLDVASSLEALRARVLSIRSLAPTGKSKKIRS